MPNLTRQVVEKTCPGKLFDILDGACAYKKVQKKFKDKKNLREYELLLVNSYEDIESVVNKFVEKYVNKCKSGYENGNVRNFKIPPKGQPLTYSKNKELSTTKLLKKENSLESLIDKLRTMVQGLKENSENNGHDQIDLSTYLKITGNSYYFGNSIVTKEDIRSSVAILKGASVINTIHASNKDVNLESLIHRRVIGQGMAIESVVRALRRADFGLRDPNRPIASFIFAGTSGTGKTELAKAIAEAYFGSEQALFRLDMSEYQSSESITRLIGAAPGYIGYEEGGTLTNWVKKKPCSIILFDEIEKADKKLFNILLQLLDDGHITDSKGSVVFFSDTLIILTTNAGTKVFAKTRESLIKKTENKGFIISGSSVYDALKKKVLETLKEKVFRPEIINRFDDVIIFKQLSKRDTCKIVSILLINLSEQMEESGVIIYPTRRLKNLIIELSYDPEYGTRPIRRALAQYIESPLSESLLRNNFNKDQKVVVDLVVEKQDFTKNPAEIKSIIKLFTLSEKHNTN